MLISSFDLLYDKDLVLVKFLVQRELPSLAEGFRAALVRALERLLTCVGVHVLLQILSEGECLLTIAAFKFP